MKETALITRRTRLVWDFSCDPSHYDTVGIPYPDKPYHVGTIKTLTEKIKNESILSYHTPTFFVKVNGQWRRINSDSAYELSIWDFEPDRKSIRVKLD